MFTLVIRFLALTMALSPLAAAAAAADVRPSMPAVSVVPQRSTLFLPLLGPESGWGVRVVLRPKSATTRATARIFDQKGAIVSELADFELSTAIEVPIYVESAALAILESDEPIEGYVLYASTTGGAEAVSAGAGAAPELDFPILAPEFGRAERGAVETRPIDRADWARSTTIAISNPGEHRASFDVLGVFANALTTKPLRSYTIEAHASITIQLSDAIDTDLAPSINAVRIVASAPLVGVQLTDIEGRDLVGLAAPEHTSDTWSISLPGKADSYELWSSVNLSNPNDHAVEVVVEGVDPGGESFVVDTLSLEPGELRSFTSNNIGGGLVGEATGLLVRSSAPIVASQIVGTLLDGGLSAYPVASDHAAGEPVVLGGSEGGRGLRAYQFLTAESGSMSVDATLGETWRTPAESSAAEVPDAEKVAVVPAAPIDLTATTLNSNSVALYWHDQADNESSFKIERRTNGGAWGLIATVSANLPSFSRNSYANTGLNTDSNSYAYRIRAYNSSGYSGFSNEAAPTYPATSDGFDYPVGDVNGNGQYSYYEGTRICTSTYLGSNWYVAYDVTDPEYSVHTGEDWNGACFGDTDRDEPVYAASIGRVVYAGYVPDDWGRVVLIAHRMADGSVYYSQYAHLESISVSPGAYVSRRQQVGRIGKGTGTYDAHLHFEMRRATVGVGNWPRTQSTIRSQYFDPTDRARDTWTETGFVDRHRVITPPTGGGTCSQPNNLTAGQPYTGNTSGGPSAFGSYGCSTWNESGPERVHRITLSSGGTITASLSGMTSDLDVFLLSNCSASGCFAFGDGSASATVGAGTYYVVVDGYNGAAGPYTLLVTTTGGPSTPTAPSNLSANAVSSSQINLTWADNSSNEAGFRIERKTGSGGSFAEITTVGAGATSFSSGGLAPNSTYYFRVRAYNSNGSSGYSNEAGATTQTTGSTPSAPSNLSASAASSSQINLTWTDNSSNETGFRIERKLGSGGSFAEITTVGAGATTFSSGGLAPNSTYYFRVRAYNSAGGSSYSNESGATTTSTQCSSSTVSISSNQTLSGSLATTDCTSTAGQGSGSAYYDLFTFSGSSGQAVTITLNSTAFDTFLRLKNPAGTVVASDDDGNGGSNSKIVVSLAASGTFTIETTGYYPIGGANPTTGSYTVNYSATTPPPTEIAWQFNSSGNLEGWTCINISGASVNSGSLFIDPLGADPYVFSPTFSVSGATYRNVQFAMASNLTDGFGRIYYQTSAEQFWSEDKAVSFSAYNCYLCGNAPFYSYVVYMGSSSKWNSGTITRIRIDPGNNGSGSTNADSCAWDYVRVTQ